MNKKDWLKSNIIIIILGLLILILGSYAISGMLAAAP